MTGDAAMTWRRPVPVIGDRTSAAERGADPKGWAFEPETIESLYRVLHDRRDIRRFRAEEIDDGVLLRLLGAAHSAPSVGHSQPWRFVLVRDVATRDRAAWLADRERLAQAAQLEPAAAGHLLDLKLEGILEAPMGIVVCCDRRTAAAGVLGRATFPDTDLWSCACAIQNLWLAARAEGLGVGWVTLFRPEDLAALVGLPDDVVPLGWLCVGWPDERPPEPGLERAAWSQRLELEDVLVQERWSDLDAPPPPRSRLRGPGSATMVDAQDDADAVLSPPGSLGVLDRVIDRAVALGWSDLVGGTLVLAVGRHPVTELGVSAYEPSVTDEVLAAARAGESLGAATAAAAGLKVVIVDAGTSSGNLQDEDAMTPPQVAALIERGRSLGLAAGPSGLVALGEIGIGNTTVAAALTAFLLDLTAEDTVGRGAGADSAMVHRKRKVVAAALARLGASEPGARSVDPLRALSQLGGPEFALLTGVTLGAAEAGALIVLDGLATSVAALLAVLLEPAVVVHLVAGQRSREPGHPLVLAELGLEPLLDLRIRAGEGAGAAMAANLVLHALAVRRAVARTA
jgi:nicotinate-nucleotide--dimethylbenzimidazole phosphoribosyltransferase